MDFELTKEQLEIRENVRDFVKRHCTKEYIRSLDETEKFPDELWAELTKAGFNGVSIDPKYGGIGGDIITQVIITEELARALGGVTWAWANTSCFGGKSVGLYGTEEQKKFFLPKFVRGEVKVAFAITEPGGGTDILGAMTTFATEVEDGFIINGTKIFTTAAHVSEYHLVIARSKKKEELVRKSDGISVFLVDSSTPGVTCRIIPKLGMKAVGTCEVVYNNVKVPKENMLGDKHSGWVQLTGTLNNERILNATVCLGIGQAALDDAIEYAKERKSFGKPIGQFQAIQHYLADMAIDVQQARLLIYYAASLQSKGINCGKEATMSKIAASDMATRVADKAIQIFGGHGYTMDHDINRYWRDVRVLQIGPVTNEMGRNYVAMELGMPRSY